MFRPSRNYTILIYHMVQLCHLKTSLVSPCSLLPLGIASLIAGKLVEVESYATLVQDLGLYTVTVLTGLFIHALIVLPLIYFLITRRNPFAMMGQIAQALLTAFGTSSRYRITQYHNNTKHESIISY